MIYCLLTNFAASCKEYTRCVFSKQRLFSLLVIVGTFVILSSCHKNSAPEIEGMVYIPAGKFIMGSNDEDNQSLAKEFGARETFFINEKPARKIYLKGFYIDKFEITNETFRQFIIKTGYIPPSIWNDRKYEQGRENHPIKNISWLDANSYCALTGKRLPTEEEWEKAARGPNGSIFPWGNEFDVKKANLDKGDTVPVGSMPEDKSFFGVFDMGGNLREWTNTWYKPYPGSTFQSEAFGEKFKVIRGMAGNIVGHYNLPKIFSRSSYRSYIPINIKLADMGFRCAKDREG